MCESLFSASMHHIPPVPPSISFQSTQRPRGKVMQEPHLGALLHHFSTTSRQAARIRGARRIRVAFKGSEKRSTTATALRASLLHPNSRKERIDDGDSVQNVPSSIFTAFTERTQIRILFMNSKLPLWRFFSISKTEYWVERSDFRPGFDFH